MDKSAEISEIKKSELYIQWIESFCRIPRGKNVGQPFKLSDTQRGWMSMIYDSPTRTFILSIARKNGKTTFSAALLLLHLCGPASIENGRIYSAARTRDQASIIFDLACDIIKLSPDLREYVTVKSSTKELEFKARGTKYKALSSDASNVQGLEPCFVIHDELGQVRGERDELYEALETATGVIENPLSVIISTQSPTDSDLLSILIDDAITDSDPKIKCKVYSADKDCDITDIKQIEKANPHINDFLDIDKIIDDANSAVRMPSRESSFRNLKLNQRVESRDPFVSHGVWRDNNAKPDNWHGKKIYIGLDLSTTTDLSVISIIHVDKNLNYHSNAIFYLPLDNLGQRSRDDRVPYSRWHKEGYLTATPGATIDYKDIANDLFDIYKKADVQAFAYDRWGISHLRPYLEEVGFKEKQLKSIQPFGQGFKDMSPALNHIESLLLNKKIRHGDNPIMTMCATNAAVVEDPAGNRKLVKYRRNARIDGMIALAMSSYIAKTNKINSKPHVFVI